MSVQATPVVFPSSLRSIVRATESVNVESLEDDLKSFLESAGTVHLYLFSIPLCVTSGKDGTGHVSGSAHLVGKAADLRSNDKTAEQQCVFGVVLAYLGGRYGVGIYDERNFKAGEAHSTGGHWHLEIA